MMYDDEVRHTVCMSKPLMNRLLLKNSNKPDDTTPETLRKVPVPKYNQDSLFGEW
jgi:hypothetical protein